MLALLAFAAALQGAASADVLDQANAARLAGRPAEAQRLYEAAVASAPNNADAWLGLGLSHSQLKQWDEAERAFRRALVLAPGYPDAQLALARVAFFRGDVPEAQRRLDGLDPPARAGAEAQAFAAQLQTARRAAAPWRADLWAGNSRLSGGLEPWREIGAALSRRADGGAASGSLEWTSRFGQEDVYLEGRLQRGWQGGSLELAVGGAPEADHRAELALGVAGAIPITARSAQLVLEGGVARFPDAQVQTFHPGLSTALGPVRLTGRWINLWEKDAGHLSGFTVDGEWTVRPGFELGATFGDAPETSEGRPVDVESLSLRASADLTPRLRVRLVGVSEQRRAYDREQVSVALTARY